MMTGCSKKVEPDRVEYTKSDGQKTVDVKTIRDGSATYQVIGGRPVPAQAEKLHREARVKGEAGEYASALALLRKASEIAPDWAYPYYDMAFTYLLQGDATNAFSNYQEVERLEPKGFFTTKTALWTLDRERKGNFPKGTYLAFLSLEWTKPEARRAIIERMTTQIPTFAPAWKEKALLIEGTDQRLAAFEYALSLAPDAETYGICVLNKAALLNKLGRAVEAKQLVEELIRSDSSTVSTKALAKEVLKTLKK
jgi:tetratricopeptide (TPR) repeat protein